MKTRTDTLILALLSAAASGNNKEIGTLITQSHVDVNATGGPEMQTALDCAVRNNRKETVKFLLNLGADANIPRHDGLGVTPLHTAIMEGHLECVSQLLANKADVHLAMSNGMTALCLAAKNGYPGLVAELLKHKATYDVITSNGDSPLSLAADNGHAAVIEILVNEIMAHTSVDQILQLMQKDNFLRSRLASAKNGEAYASLLKIIDHLLKNKVGIEVIKPLLPTQFDFMDKSFDPLKKQLTNRLHLAIQSNNRNEVIFSILAGADVTSQNVRHEVILDDVARSARSETITAIMELRSAAVLKHGIMRSLLMATQYDNTDCIKAFVDKLISPEYSLETLLADLQGEHNFKSCLENARSGESFLALYKLIKYLQDKGVSKDIINSLLPKSDFFKHDSYIIHKLKENILAAIKLMPLQECLAMCNEALDPEQPLGYIMHLQRGAKKCRPGHGILGEIAAAKTAAIKNPVLALKVNIPNIMTELTLASHPSFKSTLSLNLDVKEIIDMNFFQSADINARDGDFGQTALDKAASFGRLDTMRRLISLGADVNIGREYDNCLTPLFIAAQYGQTKVVEFLLENGANPNITRDDGMSPLSIAARYGNTKVVEALLKYNANILAVTTNQDSPLSLASQHGHAAVIKLLIKKLIADHSPDALIKVIQKNQIFSRACTKASTQDTRDALLDLIAHLIMNKADLNTIKNLIPLGFMPAAGTTTHQINNLINAATNGDTRAIITHYLQGADINRRSGEWRGQTAILVATCNKKHEAIALLISLGADVNIGDKYDEGCTPLYYAVGSGNLETIKILLNAGADPYRRSKYGHNPLSIAAQNGNLEVIECLVKHAIENNTAATLASKMLKNDYLRNSFKLAKNGETFFALLKIIEHLQKNNIDPVIIKELLPDRDSFHHADDERYHNTLLINKDLKKLILDQIKLMPLAERIIHCNHALNENQPLGMVMFIPRGKTKCHLGHGILKEIEDVRDEALKLTIKEQKQAEESSMKSRTPQQLNDDLLTEVINKRIGRISDLIKQGADVNAVNTRGGVKTTVLDAAATSGDTAIVILLIESGANVNKARENEIDVGVTPIFMAATTQKSAVVSLLLQHQAKINLITKLGTTPLSIAIKNGDSATIKLLVDHLISGYTSTELLAHLKDMNNFQNCIKAAKDSEAFFALFRLIDHLLANNVGSEDIIKLLPLDNSYTHNEIVNRTFKENILEKIKSLPIAEQIIMCDKAMDPHHPLGYMMHLTRGATKCSIKHGVLLKVAQVKAAATAATAATANTKTLFTAGASGDLTKVKQCLANGVNINYVNNDGWTVLLEASDHAKTEMVGFLLMNGADASFKWKVTKQYLTDIVSKHSKKTKENLPALLSRFNTDEIEITAEDLAVLKGWTNGAKLLREHREKLQQPVAAPVGLPPSDAEETRDAAQTSTVVIQSALTEAKPSNIYPSIADLRASLNQISPMVVIAETEPKPANIYPSLHSLDAPVPQTTTPIFQAPIVAINYNVMDLLFSNMASAPGLVLPLQPTVVATTPLEPVVIEIEKTPAAVGVLFSLDEPVVKQEDKSPNWLDQLEALNVPSRQGFFAQPEETIADPAPVQKKRIGILE